MLSTTSATTAATATKHQVGFATRITALEEEYKMLRDTLGMLESMRASKGMWPECWQSAKRSSRRSVRSWKGSMGGHTAAKASAGAADK